MKTSVKLSVHPVTVLRIVFGLFFLSAAIYRSVYFGVAQAEMRAIGLPSIFAYGVIGIELFFAFTFIMNRFLRAGLAVCAGFLAVGLALSIVVNGKAMAPDFGELFVLDSTPTDIFVHGIYLVFMVVLFIILTNEKRRK